MPYERQWEVHHGLICSHIEQEQTCNPQRHHLNADLGLHTCIESLASNQVSCLLLQALLGACCIPADQTELFIQAGSDSDKLTLVPDMLSKTSFSSMHLRLRPTSFSSCRLCRRYALGCSHGQCLQLKLHDAAAFKKSLARPFVYTVVCCSRFQGVTSLLYIQGCMLQLLSWSHKPFVHTRLYAAAAAACTYMYPCMLQLVPTSHKPFVHTQLYAVTRAAQCA